MSIAIEPGLGQPRAEELAPVHVFSFRGRRYGFFVRTGDLVELNDAAHLALSMTEEGVRGDELEARLRGRLGDGAEEVLADLAELEGADLMRHERAATEGEKAAACESLLRHQPRNLMFFVTEKCNLACTYCYEKNQGVHAKGRTLKQVDARRILDKYFEGSPGRKAMTITFFGGEPLLNPKVIRDTVAYAKEKAAATGQAVDFTMTTNLTLLTEDMAEFLAAEKFHVMVSLDGDREDNDRYRKTVGGKGTYDTVVANLRMLSAKLRAAGARQPKIRSTLSEENWNALETEEHLRTLTPLVEIGETHGTATAKSEFDVSEDTVDRMTRVLEARIDDLLARLERDPDTVPPLPPSMQKVLQRIHGEITREQPHEAVMPKLCGVCRNMKAVTPGGDLYPCHRYVGMPAFKMGNMHTGLDEEKVRGYYDRIHDVFAEKCAPCWLRHLCGGQCPWYLSNDDGELTVPDEASCDSIRAGYERNLGMYATLLHSYPKAFEAYVGADAGEVSGCCSSDPADAGSDC